MSGFPSIRINICLFLSRVESHITTDGQSASLSWNKAAIWSLRPDFYYRQTVAGLMWGTLSDERTGLSFTVAAALVSAIIHGSASRGTLPILKVKVTLRLKVSQSVRLGHDQILLL
jgi:hypothetical protein